MIYVLSRRRKLENLKRAYPDARIIDVTSKADLPMVRFSPFYPHGGIPIPFSPGQYAASVEGIWQGLKVFNEHDVDTSKFRNRTMKGMKRTVRKYGKPKGHRKGVEGAELLDYITARKEIYLPAYRWVLENKLGEELVELKRYAAGGDLILLDYETNGDMDDPTKPLSHAQLVKMAIEGKAF